MAKLLLNLHHVPSDELDTLTALLAEHGIECYETPPSRWGISFGGLWLRHDEQFAEARKLMFDYEASRASGAREALAAARASGSHDTFWRQLRREPWRVLWTLIGIVVILALVALPIYLLAP